MDISGFTALSERLARRGKIGAELLVDTIGSCLTNVLTVAYAYGGGLLKFGGDALLLLFSGAEHEARASNAAIAMRRTLRETGSFDVSGLRVSLRMSIGVHTGVFHFFLVGESHRELILTGPAASRTVALEAAANAGEILVSEQTAAALPSAFLGAEKEGGRLIRKAGPTTPSSTAAQTPVQVGAGVDLSKCVPVALRESLLATVRPPEHRRVTVAFVHFDGTDALIESSSPDRVADLLESLITVVQRSSARYGVSFVSTDVDRDGGKIILTAGAPTSAGDDERRMLLALRELVETPLELSVRVGVHRGAVFAGDIGPPYRRTYTVMGDVVNLAARLMARALPGEIIASQEVVERSSGEFETEMLEPFLVKGKRYPVYAMRVGPTVGAKQMHPASSTPLVGRRAEMEVFSGAIAAARSGEGTLIELVGGAGLGKSRLAQELQGVAHGFVQLSTSCEPYESATPYFPLRGLLLDLMGIALDAPEDRRVHQLHDVIGNVASELLPWAPLIGDVVDISMPETRESAELDARFRGARLAEVLTQLLEKLLPTPTLIIVEDAHWMDDASAELLRRLAAELATRPWLLCFARREQDGGFAAPDGTGTMLRVAPLSDAETVDFLHQATEHAPLAPYTLAALAQRSGGNPLYLRELAAIARTGDRIDALPDSVEALITARIDRLAPHDRDLLRRVSVLGISASEDLLQAVVDDTTELNDDTWARLSDFIRREGDTHFSFDQAMARDCAYEGLSYRLRRRLHAQVADVIADAAGEDSDAHAALLSLHYLHAERYREAWTYALLAANSAAEIYASVEASELYERALEAGRHLRDLEPQESSAVHEAVGDVRDRMGDFAGAEVSYRTVRRLTKGDPVANARLLLKLARVQGWQDRYSQALSSITRGLRALDALDDNSAARQRAQLLSWYARFCLQAGRHRKAIEFCGLAIEEAEAADEKEALADALQVLDWAYEDLGRFDLATNSQRALALYEELGNLPGQTSIFNTLGVAAHARGEWQVALEAFEHAQDAVQRTGDAVMHGACSNNIGEIVLDQGRVDEAAELFRDALRAWQATGIRAGIAFAKRNLARVASRSGLHSESIRLFEESLAESTAVGAHTDVVETNARLAEALVVCGDAEEALALSSATLDRARSLGGVTALGPLVHRVRGAALARLGNFAAAKEALDRSLEAGRTRNADYEVALTQRTIAQLQSREGNRPDDRLLAESDAVFERLSVVSVSDLLA